MLDDCSSVELLEITDTNNVVLLCLSSHQPAAKKSAKSRQQTVKKNMRSSKSKSTKRLKKHHQSSSNSQPDADMSFVDSSSNIDKFDNFECVGCGQEYNLAQKK